MDIISNKSVLNTVPTIIKTDSQTISLNYSLNNKNIDELIKLKQEYIDTYNHLKSNNLLLIEVLTELEQKSTKILEDIYMLKLIHNSSLKLFTEITRHSNN